MSGWRWTAPERYGVGSWLVGALAILKQKRYGIYKIPTDSSGNLDDFPTQLSEKPDL